MNFPKGKEFSKEPKDVAKRLAEAASEDAKAAAKAFRKGDIEGALEYVKFAQQTLVRAQVAAALENA